ncbi:MAG: cytochrome P450 [Gemmatimonadota bacterium]
MLFDGRITNAPHVPRSRTFREARALVRNPVEVMERYRREYGRTFTLHLGGARPAIVSIDPSFIHQALHDTARYHVSTVRVDRMAEFQGQGLINSHGSEWLRKRRFLSRGVCRERLAALLPHQQGVLEDLLTRFDLELDRGIPDMHQLMIDFTSRLVARSIFGNRMADDQIEHIVVGIRRIQELVLRQIFQPYMIPWFRISGKSRRYQRIRERGDAIARSYIDARAQNPDEDGGDILGFLLRTPTEESGEPMDKEQILIECMQFLVAGCETSPVALSWTFYLLGKHPRFIHEIRDEIDAVLGSGPMTLPALQQLRHTRRVIDEAMRIYSPFWMIDRVAVEDGEIEGVHIPRGVMVLPFIHGLHRDPELWPEPEVFDPSRFEDEAVRERHPSAHIPFGGGPRKCIGANMAMVQMILILSTFVRRYDFELANEREVEAAPKMILHPAGAIEMNVRRV